MTKEELQRKLDDLSNKREEMMSASRQYRKDSNSVLELLRDSVVDLKNSVQEDIENGTP